MRAAILTPDHQLLFKELTFEDCQKTVGGYVESLQLADGVYAYVNEDGIAMNLPRNEVATALCRQLGPNIRIDDYIKGNMIVFCGNDSSEDEESITPEVEARVTEVWTNCGDNKP